jgi:hypothetical protein
MAAALAAAHSLNSSQLPFLLPIYAVFRDAPAPRVSLSGAAAAAASAGAAAATASDADTLVIVYAGGPDQVCDGPSSPASRSPLADPSRTLGGALGACTRRPLL